MSTIARLLALHDKLTWPGIARMVAFGFALVAVHQMYQRADLWFPRLMDSPVALALMVGCAIVATYAVVQDRLVSRVDERTDRVHTPLREEIERLRSDQLGLRAELAQARADERDCINRTVELAARISAMERSGGRA